MFIVLILFPSIIFPGISEGQDKNEQKLINNYGGIGISIEIDSTVRLPYIVEVISDKPGALAGLRSGDYITAINHWKTKGKSKDRVVQRLRGLVGSKVRLHIMRVEHELTFEMKRAKIEVIEQPSNPCDALNMVIKAAADTFQNLKGKLVYGPETKTQVPDYAWESKVNLPKFSQCRVVKNYDREAFFNAVYFVGKDSIQAIHLFDKLVSEVRDCLPYTVAESFQENNVSDISSFKNTFIISQVKEGTPQSVKGSIVIVMYSHQPGKPSEVSLICRVKP
jgi:membrane-associated protease RseP (regulator of RpoE activity)